jgi:hypothetical protein
MSTTLTGTERAGAHGQRQIPDACSLSFNLRLQHSAAADQPVRHQGSAYMGRRLIN